MHARIPVRTRTGVAPPPLQRNATQLPSTATSSHNSDGGLNMLSQAGLVHRHVKL